MDGVRLEWAKLRRDARLSAGWQRRLGARAFPVVAVAAAGAAGLCARKRAQPPEDDLLGKRASFQCGAVAETGLPSAAVTQRVLEREAGVDGLSALRRAARRLRGPLERDIMAAEQRIRDSSTPGDQAAVRQRLYSELVDQWRGADFLSEPKERASKSIRMGIDLVTQVDESYGRDVGVEVPLCMLRDPSDAADSSLHSLGPQDWAAAAEALEQHGIVRLKGLVPPTQIQKVRDRLGLQASALDRNRKDARGLLPVRAFDVASLQAEDPDLEPVVSAPGRTHFYIRGRPLETVVRDLQAGALPLVWEHLSRTAPGSRPYVSEVQILVAEPCAADQFWHVDNANSGLSLFVPLTAVPADIGATLFLPGTHHLFEADTGRIGRSAACASSLLSSSGVIAATLEAGDAVLYDARTIHRCSQNRRLDRMRIGIMFRYDVEMPPGVGVLGTQAVSWAGSIFSSFMRFYAALPSGA